MILDTLKRRLQDALLRPAPSKADLGAALFLAESVNDEGAWPDLDYSSKYLTPFGASRHLERTLALARARRSCGAQLDAALVRALDFWLVRDFQDWNWWHNQIGVPRLAGATALLLEDGLSPGARGKVIEILARARWSHSHQGPWKDFTGANLLWIAYNILLRGCIENFPALCQEACERVHAEIRVAQVGEEGLQADMSFHQHGALLYSGGYGIAFAENAALFLILTHGTPWQAPADCLGLFTSFLLDGQQWMIRHGVFDYGALDREIARGPKDLSKFADVVELLADGGITPRRAEMASFARRLRGASGPDLSGHRHYWRSDFAVHRRPGFYTSVRMSSRRTITAESINDEGKQSHHVADGLTYILRDGGEYRDIFAVWDWRRLPGITAVQSPQPLDPRSVGGRGGGGFVGGVSDGEYGLAIMDLARDGLRARKAWFYFDDSFVCLGNGIGCDDAAGPVYTSINQCLLRGSVTAFGKGGETHVLAPGRSYDLSAAHRVEHDGICYHFPEPTAVRARLAPQTGSWSAVGTGSAEELARDVFSLWIDHGMQPGGGEGYAYTVLPAAGTDNRAATDHEIAQIRIVANTPSLQAVYHQELRLVGIVFWEQGIVDLPGGGRVAVNRPCVVLCHDRRPEGMRLSIANPTNEPTTIHVEYANRCQCFELPGGLKGGQSVTRVL